MSWTLKFELGRVNGKENQNPKGVAIAEALEAQRRFRMVRVKSPCFWFCVDPSAYGDIYFLDDTRK